MNLIHRTNLASFYIQHLFVEFYLLNKFYLFDESYLLFTACFYFYYIKLISLCKGLFYEC